MPHNQCQSTQLWGLHHLWLANEISLPAHHRVSNWPEPGQRGAVGVWMSQPSTELSDWPTCSWTDPVLLHFDGSTHVWYLWKLTVTNQMVLPNLLTSYKSGSLPAVSRSLIPRLEESDTNLQVITELPSCPRTPCLEPLPTSSPAR